MAQCIKIYLLVYKNRHCQKYLLWSSYFQRQSFEVSVGSTKKHKPTAAQRAVLFHSCPGTRSGYLHCGSASLTSLPQPNHISVICFSSLRKFNMLSQVDQLMWKPTIQPSYFIWKRTKKKSNTSPFGSQINSAILKPLTQFLHKFKVFIRDKICIGIHESNLHGAKVSHILNKT